MSELGMAAFLVRSSRRLPAPLAFLLLLVIGLSSPARAALFTAESFTLGNGLRVVVVENHRAPVVLQMIFYQAGSADAPPGKSGIAHFLEHLMFKGTPSVPAGEFSHRVALMGGEDNAFTTEDYTAFHQTVARSHLAEVMQLEADRMTHLVLAESQVDSERAVIIEERRRDIDNEPAGQLIEMMTASLFLNHPYRLPVLGWAHEMVTLSRQDALDFYQRWYAPNNAILIIAGDVTVAEVRPLAEKIYGPIPARSLPPRIRLTEPTAFAPRELVLRSPDVHQTFWQRIYLAPTYRDPPAATGYGLDVLAELLAGGANSRLYKDLVVAKGIATEVDADYDASLRDYGRFSITAVPPVGGAMTKLGQAIDAELADLLAKGVSDAEVAAAKGRLQADAIKARDGLMGPARLIGISLSVGLSLDEVQNWSDRIATVTPADVMAAARKVLQINTSVTGELQAEAQP
jgi:zinc protease